MKKVIFLVLFLAVVVSGGLLILLNRQQQQTINTRASTSVLREKPTASPESERQEKAKAIVTVTPVEVINPAIPLQVTQPTPEASFKTSSIMVKGKTAPSANVSVNEVDTTADAAGNFSVPYTLDEGENYISVVVNNAQGEYAEKELHVELATE